MRNRKRFRGSWLWPLLLGLAQSLAAETAAIPQQPSIPYPNGSLYLQHGILASFAGGRDRNYGENQSLYQWQGEIEYYYTPWLSGGFGFKMIAGEPSDSSLKVKNRFFIVSRVHKAWSKVSAYFGVLGGVDDLNISLAPLDTGNFRAPLQETNAGLSFEAGVGWKFSRYVGATWGERLELSFVGEASDNPEGAVNFRSFPGLALDLLALFPKLHETVGAFYFFVEGQSGRLILESPHHRTDAALIGGLSLAF